MKSKDALNLLLYCANKVCQTVPSQNVSVRRDIEHHVGKPCLYNGKIYKLDTYWTEIKPYFSSSIMYALLIKRLFKIPLSKKIKEEEIETLVFAPKRFVLLGSEKLII